MGAAATAKPKETWVEWQPAGSQEPERLFTRDEIVDIVARRHVAGTEPVSAGDLRYWESIGVLPAPVRRWHEGSARALYPEWYANLARRVRMLQKVGYSLDHIRPRIRAHARIALGHGAGGLDDEFHATGRRIESPEEIALWPDLVTELERIARWRAYLTGVPTERVEVRVIGNDGTGTLYPLPIAPHDDETETPS